MLHTGRPRASSTTVGHKAVDMRTAVAKKRLSSHPGSPSSSADGEGLEIDEPPSSSDGMTFEEGEGAISSSPGQE